MKASEFKDVLDRLAATNSRNEKKEIIREVSDSPAAISFLSGSEYDDAGLGKKTVHSCAEDVFGSFEPKPTLSEAMEQFEADPSDGKRGHALSSIRLTMDDLAEASGNEQEEILIKAFQSAKYPSVVAHACLNDWPTGVSDTTIANALDLRDSLPFYGSVVGAAEVSGEPLTEPQVGTAFSPQLAKSESSLPKDKGDMVGQVKLDGIRGLLHICQKDKTFDNGKRVKMFSRRQSDITESLPELEEISWPDGSWIVDLEIISETGSYSDTSERIGRKANNVSRETEMNFSLFDVIEFASEPVHDEPFVKRYGLTTAFADLTPDERVGALPIYRDVEKAKEISSDYEGLIWKDINAPYEFGSRSKAWVKEKHQSENVDVRISGMVEGEGRLDGSMGKLSIESAEGEDVGHVGTGFSDEQRDEIWQNQDEWVGEVIEVEAEAYDSSLRFPRYKRDRRDDGSADSIEKIRDVMPEA